MSKQSRFKKHLKEEDISGSETVMEQLKSRTPWIFGDKLRKPKMKFPSINMQRRFTLPSPSKTFFLILVYIFLFVLQLGILYILYRDTIAVGATSEGNPIFIYPKLHYQFIIEGIIASIVIFLASLGFIIIYQSSKYVYDRSTVVKVLATGIVLTLIGFVVLQMMLSVKTQVFKEFLQNLIGMV